MGTPESTTAALAHQLADRASVADIECHGVQVHTHGQRWYDTRPMLDRHEYCDQSIDMARQAIDYALQRGLVEPHPGQPHLLRITDKGRAL